MCKRHVARLTLSNGGAVSRDRVRDQLVVEAPLELRLGGESVLVLMRTPGHDRELARGLMFAEGAIDSREELADMAEPHGLTGDERGNVLELGVGASAMPSSSARAMLSSSSCGVCGKTSIADLEVRAPAIHSDVEVPARVIAALPERLRSAQVAFEQTGGLHAAAAFDPRGNLLAVREDVGRHNALDKLIGWALSNQFVPMRDTLVCVSGRVSFEIVQKAVIAGVPVIVAVSAPSSLAVDLAERFRITLCGFTRDGRFNIYSHASRIT